MVLGSVNSLPCGLYQFMSLSEGTALLFESEWVLYLAFGSPPPIDSIRDITGAEKKLSQKPAAFG